ncbi:uncharacterized protein LOC143552701 [Bidens hawaiensis]|uniref:uncharacterized protein LOC143552701 n=1 Tax=Bidens hawaiensis TaxID=980011 RepID=UPI00404B5E85
MWSLWNPMTSKIIRLPRLITDKNRGSDIIQEFCLSSPLANPGSILMVTAEKHTIIFCRLDCKRKRSKWVEMSYAKHVRSIMGCDGFLFSLTCYNDKVYALSKGSGHVWVIHIDIVVVDGEIVISLLPYIKVPSSYVYGCLTGTPFLIGCCTELFYVVFRNNRVGNVEKTTIAGVLVFKLDMDNLRWEKMEDLKDVAFFLDFAHDYSAFYSPSGLGGYVHFLDEYGKVIHSYDFKNKTIALSSMSEHRLHGEIKSQQEDGGGNEVARVDKEIMESRLLNVPFDVLKTIMEFCVGVEYLNFRATCKQCQLAAPMIQWSKGGRLQTYSLLSPWLMVLHKDRGEISFTESFGVRYFINTPRELIGDVVIYSSVCGWLLIRRREGPLMFFNPFTNCIRELSTRALSKQLLFIGTTYFFRLYGYWIYNTWQMACLRPLCSSRTILA